MIASVVLVSSNPTKLVLSGAFALKWTSYIAHVVLPFVGAAVTVYPLLLYMFRAPELIPPSLDLDLADVGEIREYESQTHDLHQPCPTAIGLGPTGRLWINAARFLVAVSFW